jgi:hypothetical protein
MVIQHPKGCGQNPAYRPAGTDLFPSRANPAKVEDFGAARGEEKWMPVFRPITRPLRILITFNVIDDLLKKYWLARILFGEVIPLRREAR